MYSIECRVDGCCVLVGLGEQLRGLLYKSVHLVFGYIGMMEPLIFVFLQLVDALRFHCDLWLNFLL